MRRRSNGNTSTIRGPLIAGTENGEEENRESRFHKQLNSCVVAALNLERSVGSHSLDRPAVEEHDPLQLLVVEEVVEAPQRSWLAERVWVQVRIVAVNVAVVQLNLVVNRRPQRVLQLRVWNEREGNVNELAEGRADDDLHCSPATADKLESMEFMINCIDGSLLNSWLWREIDWKKDINLIKFINLNDDFVFWLVIWAT